MEIDDGHLWLVAAVTNKNGSGVAHPAAIGRPLVELDPAHVRAGALEHAARELLLGRRIHQQVNDLARRELAHHLAINPLHRRELPRPIGGIMRPAQPRRLVPLPLRRHGKAQRGGRLLIVHHQGSIIQNPKSEIRNPKA